MSTPKLAEAVAAVMSGVKYIKETGFNEHDRYKYASDEDLLAAVQPLMAKNGLALLPVGAQVVTTEAGTTKAGAVNIRSDIVMTWRLAHISGESVDLQMPGSGVDRGDKGVYKALTGALKYLIRHLFLVPTGNDPERVRDDEEPAAKPKPEQRKEAAPAEQAERKPSAKVLEQLANKGWSGTSTQIVADVDDFFAWLGKPSPWSTPEARQEQLPAFMASQQEALEEWIGWRGDFADACKDIGVSLARVDEVSAGKGRPKTREMPADQRKKLLQWVKTEPGQKALKGGGK